MKEQCRECPGRHMFLTPEQQARVEEFAADGQPIACHMVASIAKGDIGQRPAQPGERQCVWAEMLAEELISA